MEHDDSRHVQKLSTGQKDTLALLTALQTIGVIVEVHVCIRPQKKISRV